MSSAVVTPWRGEHLWVSGPDRWTWQSIRPGRRYPPVAASRRSPAEIAADDAAVDDDVVGLAEALPVEDPDVRAGRSSRSAGRTAAHSSANASCETLELGTGQVEVDAVAAAGLQRGVDRRRRGEAGAELVDLVLVGHPEVVELALPVVHRHGDPRADLGAAPRSSRR